MQEWQKLVAGASEASDLATVLIAGTGAFLLDSALSPVGFLTAPNTAALTASGALGLKKGWEAAMAARRARRAWLKNRSRAKALMDMMHQRGREDLAERLRLELELRDAGVIDDAELGTSLRAILATVRT